MKLFKVILLCVILFLGNFAGTAAYPSVLAESQIIKNEICRTTKFPILMYHHVREYLHLGYKASIISVSPSEFREQMRFLSEHGYTAITPKDIIHKTVPCNAVMITFDDGYKDVMPASRIMKTYGFSGVVGLIIDRMDERDYLTGDDIRLLEGSGWEIANHTWSHFNLSRTPISQLHHEIGESKIKFEEWFNIEVNTFVYPGGFYGALTKKEVLSSGHIYALTTHPGIADLEGPLTELHRIDMLPGMSIKTFAAVLEEGRLKP